MDSFVQRIRAVPSNLWIGEAAVATRDVVSGEPNDEQPRPYSGHYEHNLKDARASVSAS